MLECVVNVSEGRRPAVVDAIASAAEGCLLDVHADKDHHRAVLTLAGEREALEEAVCAVAAEAVRRIDLRRHDGAHPRLGAIDVVPFVPLGDAPMTDALAARDRVAARLATDLGVPCFLYGPERSLPDIRRRAFHDLSPDVGAATPHPTAGATCVGARPMLVAYNVWLADGVSHTVARSVAAALRGPAVRALGVDVGGRAQVSMNLLEPLLYGPVQAFDDVAARAPVARAELVGLVPAAVLASVPASRWSELDLDANRSIEHRLGRGRKQDP